MKTQLLIPVLFLTLIPSLASAYPHVYRRLVVPIKNIPGWAGQEEKVIDLIGDVHIPENFEKEEMGQSDAALLAALRELGERDPNHPVELLGESSDAFREQAQKMPTLTQIAIDTHGLSHLGHRFHTEYAPEKKKGLVYRDSDTYRSGFDPCGLIGPDSPIKKDLKVLDHPMAGVLKNSWSTFKKKVLEPYCSGSKHLTPAEQQAAIIKGMDFELLIKLMGSQHRHVIVFAGSSHIHGLVQLLELFMGAKQVDAAGKFLSVSLPEAQPPAPTDEGKPCEQPQLFSREKTTLANMMKEMLENQVDIFEEFKKLQRAIPPLDATTFQKLLK